jgi:glycine cleavage system H protein
VESVKAASDIISPISGEVIEVNEILPDQPELVNSSPYEDAWLFRLQPSDDDDNLEKLLTVEQYIELIKEEE